MTKLEMDLAWSQTGQNAVMTRYVPVITKEAGRNMRQKELALTEG